jgi:hypothetical protein
MLERTWRTWNQIAHAIATFQARVLLAIFYALIMFPFGVFARLFLDSLRTKHRPTQWLDRPCEIEDLEWAKRQ